MGIAQHPIKLSRLFVEQNGAISASLVRADRIPFDHRLKYPAYPVNNERMLLDKEIFPVLTRR